MHRWVDHTGDLELELAEQTIEGVFAEATRALSELIAIGHRPSRHELRMFTATGPDPASMLAGWLEELLFAAESGTFVPLSAHGIRVDEGHVRGLVEGYPGEVRPIVKAVTFHRLRCAPGADGWDARVVFDA